MPLGRIGFDYYRKDPNEVCAIIDSAKIGMGTPPSQVFLGVQGEDAPDGGGAKLTPGQRRHAGGEGRTQGRRRDQGRR